MKYYLQLNYEDDMMNGKITVTEAFERLLNLITNLDSKQRKLKTKVSKIELQNMVIQKENEILHDQLEKLHKKLNGYRRF
jgi:predicted phage tail protein